MNLDFTPEQDLLRDSVRRACERHSGLDVVRKLENDPVGYSPELWQQLSELGVTGLVIDEQYGGGGMTMVDAAVVGVAHKTLGEEVKAVVQLRPGSTTTVDDLRAFCRERLANFKVPDHAELRDEPLPRNPAGKVLKNLLRGGESAFATSDDQAL